jgi:hypothetical protein
MEILRIHDYLWEIPRLDVAEGAGMRFREQPRMVREVSVLGRGMYLLQFKDGGVAFLFPEQIALHSGDQHDA